ncbi:MAG: hypothetical protein ACPLRU_00870 [Desulfofundulus sp.]
MEKLLRAFERGASAPGPQQAHRSGLRESRAELPYLGWRAVRGNRPGGYYRVRRARLPELLPIGKKYPPAGIKQRLLAIREYCNFLVATGRLSSNPAKEVQPVRAPKRSAPDVLSRSELNQLRPEVYKGGDRRDIATFERLLQAGIRGSEVISSRKRRLLQLRLYWERPLFR